MGTEVDEADVETVPVQRTGPIGRAVRGLFGLGLLLLLISPLSNLSRLSDPSLGSEPMVWLITVLAVLTVPYILDIGLGWGRGVAVQVGIVGTIAALVASDLAFLGTVWGPVLGLFVLLLQVWVFGTLALGYILAAALGTPGCELRAFAHLAARMKDRDTTHVFCPASLDRLDAWEAERRSA